MMQNHKKWTHNQKTLILARVTSLPAWVTFQGARDSEWGRALKSSADRQVMVVLLPPVITRRLPKEMLREAEQPASAGGQPV